MVQAAVAPPRRPTRWRRIVHPVGDPVEQGVRHRQVMPRLVVRGWSAVAAYSSPCSVATMWVAVTVTGACASVRPYSAAATRPASACSRTSSVRSAGNSGRPIRGPMSRQSRSMAPK